MTPPLKPCPFCGGPAADPYEGGRFWFVGCDGDKCCTRPESRARSEAEAVEAWNHRPEPVPSSVSSAIEEVANAARRRNEARCECGHHTLAHYRQGAACCVGACDCTSFRRQRHEGRTT